MTDATASNANHCAAFRRDGSNCRAAPLPASDYCFAHDPQRAEQRADARRRGGLNRSTANRVRKIGPPGIVALVATLEQALADVLAGELDTRRASAAAAIARAIIAAHQAGDMELRLQALERTAGTDGSRRWA